MPSPPTIRRPCPEGAGPAAGPVLAHCDVCELDVLDLSALSAEGAERVLAESPTELCVRYRVHSATGQTWHRPVRRRGRAGAVTLALGFGIGGVVLATLALAELTGEAFAEDAPAAATVEVSPDAVRWDAALTPRVTAPRLLDVARRLPPLVEVEAAEAEGEADDEADGDDALAALSS